MRAVVRERYGSPDVVIAIEKPKPTPRADELLVQLRYRRSLTPDGSYALIARTLTGYALTFALGGVISPTSKRKMGNFLWSPSRRSDLDTLARLLVSGAIRPLIDSHCDLDGLPDALRKLVAGQARGKIVVTMT